MSRTIAITLNWNGAEDTLACVSSLLRSHEAPAQIVVCDNASRPDSWQSLLALGAMAHGDFMAFDSLEAALRHPERPGVVLIQTGANRGYAGGMNVGLRYALADPAMQYAWVLNNDTEVHPEALQELLKRVADDAQIGICGATLLLHHQRDRVQALGGASYQPWRARSAALGMGLAIDQVPVDPIRIESSLAYVNGAAMLVRRSYLEAVGLMDERYFLYSEEHDWAYRGRSMYRLGWAPRAWVFHKHGATIGTASSGGSPLSLYYLYRSKLAFARWHHPALLCLVVPMLAWEASKFAIKGNFTKSKAAWRGLLGQPGMKPFKP